MGRGFDKDQIDFIPKRLKEVINEQGLKQEALADMIGCTPSAISKWFSRERINKHILASISTKLGVDPRYLTGEIDSKHVVTQGKNGDFTVHNPPNPTYLFDLQFTDPEKFQRVIQKMISDAQASGPVMKDSDLLKRKQRERKVALNALKTLLETSYMYPAWKQVESDEMLLNVLIDFHDYIRSLPDTLDKGKRGK